MGRGGGGAHAEGALVGVDAAARRRCGAQLDARRAVRRARDARQQGRCVEGAGEREEGHRGVLLARAVACVDGTVLRGRRRARREGDDLVGVAGDAPLPRNDREGARAAEGRRAGRLSRRLRLLWHERARRRGGRRSAHVEGSRTCGARAMVARGRARLGSQGTAAASRTRRRGDGRRQDRRLAHRDVDPEGDCEPAEHAAPRLQCGGHRADAGAHDGPHQSERGSAVRGAASGSGRALVEGCAAAAVQLSRTGQGRKLLRRRELHRHARRRGAARSGRLSPAGGSPTRAASR